MALDVTQCASEKEKLQWAFRLYDVDASGSITVKEMENIISTLDRVSYTFERKDVRYIRILERKKSIKYSP